MKRLNPWPVGITVILVVFAAGNLLMMRLASDDPSFAIEPDYYNRAVAFDSTMAEARRSAALGWTVSSTIAGVDGSHTVIVRLADSTGLPVRGARVTIDARFNARANDVLIAALEERMPGEYTGLLATTHAGEWEVRVAAARGPEHFTASTRAIAPR